MHECYIHTPSEKSKKKMIEKQEKLKILCYDLESEQAFTKDDGTLDYLPVHIPIVATLRKVTNSCKKYLK